MSAFGTALGMGNAAGAACGERRPSPDRAEIRRARDQTAVDELATRCALALCTPGGRA